MNQIDIIDKKSKKQELTKEELNFFLSSFIDKKIPDYQMSALLMAIKLNGMTDSETITFTEFLINSGEVMKVHDDWVDKHSTGGIGDKTTIALLPILGAMGLKVFKLSGRGLGYSGGTIDKLESIKGFKTSFPIEESTKIFEKNNVILLGATNIAPADKPIYYLRDVTATAASIPLIAASVMSKKLATGAKNILIDLKVGSGSFSPNLKIAEELGTIMKKIGEKFGRNVFILFTNMDEPLGKCSGNAIEIIEAVNLLNGKYEKDFYLLVEKIASELYSQSKNVSLVEAKKKFKDVLEDKSAYNFFETWIKNQGGSIDDIRSKAYFQPKIKTIIKARSDGYVAFNDIKKIGFLLIELKAGRKNKDDDIYHHSGIKIAKKQGDFVKQYDNLIEIYSKEELSDKFLDEVSTIIDIKKTKPTKKDLILKELKW